MKLYTCNTCGKVSNEYPATCICLTSIMNREGLPGRPTWGNLTPADTTSAVAIQSNTLPTDSNARKDYPLFRGLLRYFPAALGGISKTSKLGNDKHNPGEEMHHARGKSVDHGDCIIRHLVDVEDLLAAYNRGDTKVTQSDILNEVNQMAWRALAFSQELHEKFGAPLAPGAKK